MIILGGLVGVRSWRSPPKLISLTLQLVRRKGLVREGGGGLAIDPPVVVVA